MAEAEFYLPDDLWERVCTFLNDGDNNRYLKYVSVVSKNFLSITNRIRFSLTIGKEETRPFLTPIFHRFPNLTSLDLSRFRGDRSSLLSEISGFPLNITSLNISYQVFIPVSGLRAFSKNITTLKSLKCSFVDSISTDHLLLIRDCFPLLEELHLSGIAKFQGKFLNGMEALSLTLSKLRKFNFSGHTYMNDQLLFQLFNNWKLLEEAIIFGCTGITDAGIASALCVRPTLRSLSFHNFFKSDNCATLFAVVKRCPSLSDIKMESPQYTRMKEKIEENSNSLMDFVVRPQLKSLSLKHNTWLTDKNIIKCASIFPNLKLLDLSHCNQISDGICQILRRCCKLRHLNLAYCSKLKLRGMNFEVPILEVLNLSHTRVDNEELYLIAKSCRGLLQLLLENCHYMTKKGVNHVVKNCTQLREINLKNCYKVDHNVVGSMILSRPSLRNITVPPGYRFYNRERELSLSHVCLLY